jgi:hypothetical protein
MPPAGGLPPVMVRRLVKREVAVEALGEEEEGD